MFYPKEGVDNKEIFLHVAMLRYVKKVLLNGSLKEAIYMVGVIVEGKSKIFASLKGPCNGTCSLIKL